MRDDQKAKVELLQEVETLRRRVAELKQGKDVTERKQAEEELRAFEERFSSLAERSFDVIFMTDAQGYLTYISAASEKIFHYKPQEMVGTHFKNYLIESEMPRVSQRFAENMQGRNLGILPMEAMRKDGSHVFVKLNSSPILKDGETIGIQGIIRDITERKRAEEAFLFKSTLLEAQSETSIDGILVVDSEGKSISFNKNFGRMWNIPQQILDTRDDEKMLQYVLSQLKDPEQFLGRVKYLYAHKNEKSRDEIQFKDGRVFDRYSSPLLDSNDKYYGRVWYFRDVTERKQAEEALRESEERYKALFQGATEGIIVADTETKRFKYVNPAICTMLGYTEDELEQMGIRDIHPKEDLEYIISEFEAQARGEKTLTSNIPCLRKDGTIMYADINTAMVLIDGRQCNVGFFTDITEHKQAEEELSKYREKIARAERLASLGTLSATIAHRLNSPLTAIRFSIENSLADLETTSCPDTVTEDLKDGLSGVSEVVSIVDSFRNFAKKSSEKIVSQVSLKAVAERIVKLLSESARRARVSLHLKDIDELLAIYSHEKDLEQLFFALVENAIQAADGKKSRQLIIDGAVKDKQIELRFADNCGGITPENLDKIFEPFFTTRPAGEGTGLGLCVVEHIVSRAGGRVRAASKAGEGSTFFVTLPINKGRRS